ncbi:MAG: acetoin utilization deacetylase AcuC-like enzyme [Urechidicola sp.]|jgi:acetoin utilization deacetylase AcuC-like enzyme
MAFGTTYHALCGEHDMGESHRECLARIVSTLEGGNNLKALGRSVVANVHGFIG